MFSLSEYIYYFILLYTRRAVPTLTNPKYVIGKKKQKKIFKIPEHFIHLQQNSKISRYLEFLLLLFM